MTFDDIEFFSIIYSFDCARSERVEKYAPPPELRKKFELTEGDSEYEGRWKKGKHRKYGAVLSPEEFDSFVRARCLTAEDTETGGSLGAPGIGLCLVPAISFKYGNSQAYLTAYVTPIPKGEPPATERDSDAVWESVRSLVLREYG